MSVCGNDSNWGSKAHYLLLTEGFKERGFIHSYSRHFGVIWWLKVP